MPPKQKNILISGGSGFMGSHFVRFLYKNYPAYRIVNLDALTYAGNNKNLEDVTNKNRYRFIQGNICNTAFMKKLFDRYKFNAVINFAAESHVDRSIVDSLHFIRTNIQGVHTLLEIVRAHRTPRFIQISTDEIYGDVRHGTSHEESPINPSNPYAASKASADVLVQSYMRTYNISGIIVRSSNNFGTHQYPEKLIPLTVTSFLRQQKIPVHGTGEQIRRWIYVGDFCEALDKVMHRAKPHSIYNIAGTPKTNLEVIKAIGKMLGKNHTANIMHTDDRPGGDRRYAPSGTKIERELGWKPRHGFKDALTETVEWYKNNEKWWSAIRKTNAYKLHYAKQSKAEYY